MGLIPPPRPWPESRPVPPPPPPPLCGYKRDDGDVSGHFYHDDEPEDETSFWLGVAIFFGIFS